MQHPLISRDEVLKAIAAFEHEVTDNMIHYRNQHDVQATIDSAIQLATLGSIRRTIDAIQPIASGSVDATSNGL